MIAPEGYGILTGIVIISIAAVAISFLGETIVRIPVIILAIATIGFSIYFFRDPERVAPKDDGLLIVAPADGRVLEIVDVRHEPLYLDGPARRLSIFLSPLDVHVNRIPAKGIVEYVNYVPGDYLVAWHEKASELNERSEIGVKHPSGSKVLFKQIAGAVARRIVYHVEVGDSVEAGDRFGIVKFGSRMDVIVPPDSRFVVEPGERVSAGVSKIGFLPTASGQGTVVPKKSSDR